MSEPKVTELTLGSGVDVLVRPLSPFVFQKLRLRVQQLYPLPDEKAYEMEPPDAELLAMPGEKIPGSQNPDYQKAAQEMLTHQSNWLTFTVASLACEFREDRKALIARFAEQVKQLRAVIDLPEDAWEATFHYVILSSEAERQMVVAAAESRLALTEVEVAEGRRIFRPVISLETIERMAVNASGVSRRVSGQR